ncbi:MAG: glutamine amidotransferase [Clostridia bacterium]|nr:glutamine amidotransferase [Clostridia bacterium]
MERKKLIIGHLFPEFLNMYGDKGNILALQNRLLWRDIDAAVKTFGIDDEINFSALDIIVLGGGSDREQKLVCERLQRDRVALSEYVESGGVLLALCGAYPMLGKHFPLKNETLDGLSVLEIDTEPDAARHIGDVVIQSDLMGETGYIVGFENHSGKTRIGDYKPLGTVCRGFGNNGEDQSCGVIYKNLVGTYLHGPLLPKNPKLADYLLSKALLRKYGEEIALLPLCDQAENEAHDYIVERFLK